MARIKETKEPLWSFVDYRVEEINSIESSLAWMKTHLLNSGIEIECFLFTNPDRYDDGGFEKQYDSFESLERAIKMIDDCSNQLSVECEAIYEEVSFTISILAFRQEMFIMYPTTSNLNIEQIEEKLKLI